MQSLGRNPVRNDGSDIARHPERTRSFSFQVHPPPLTECTFQTASAARGASGSETFSLHDFQDDDNDHSQPDFDQLAELRLQLIAW
jgi:hypothetical protein